MRRTRSNDLNADRRVGEPVYLWSLVACLGFLFALPNALADTVEVKGEIVSDAGINPVQGRPSPVNIVLFQLKSADEFRNADFFSLYDNDSDVLGSDLIDQTRMQLQPGEIRPLEAEIDEEARYLGVIAAFRDIENAQWRTLVELPQKGFLRRAFSRDRLLIRLDALAVAASIE